MSGLDWYKKNPRDFLDAIVGMPIDEIGAYSVCLDLMYARGGPIPFEPRWLSGNFSVSTKRATALIEALVGRGKLVLRDGHLTNARVEKELENSAEISRKLRENGAKGGRNRAENDAAARENNNLVQAGLKHIREDREKKDSSNELSLSDANASSPQPRAGAASEYPKAFETWWAIYPRKEGKRDALKAYLSAGKRKGGGRDAVAFLLDRVTAYAAQPPPVDRDYPHAATWLNGGRYDDPIEENGHAATRIEHHHNGPRPGERSSVAAAAAVLERMGYPRELGQPRQP